MKKYTIGIDLGTSSIGYALIDRQMNLMKKGGKHLWGSILFDEAESAKDTRVKRSARRMKKRRRIRIRLLRDLIGKTVLKEDPMFFKKMDLSYMVDEDKLSALNIASKDIWNGLPVSLGAHKKYKSIYHLRSELITTKEKIDPRLVYLAIHHIIKYRGNFLYEGRDLNLNDESLETDHFDKLVELYQEKEENYVCKDDLIKLFAIIGDCSVKNKIKKDKIKTEFGKHIEKILIEISNAVQGYKINVKNLLFIESIGSFSFNDIEIEGLFDNELSELDENDKDILRELYELFNFHTLKKIMGNNVNLTYSGAMIKVYEKHKHDLKVLKELVYKCDQLNDDENNKEDNKKLYNIIFCAKTKGHNYYSYVKHPKGASIKVDKKIITFMDYLKKLVSSFEDDDNKKYVLEQIENQDFLPKQNSVNNSVIPYQLHMNELELILKNQGEYYPELLENGDKIISLLTFRIPYYIGPLSAKCGRFAWIEKKLENEKILPWNFNEVVDIPKTASKFIERMRNHCTYLIAEDVLPKSSLLLCEFELLNELNKVRVNEKLLAVDVKKQIIENLFMKKKKVKVKDLRDFLIDSQVYQTITDIKGTQKESEFASSLSSFIDFNSFIPNVPELMPQIEKAIEWITVYNDSKIVRSKIESELKELKPYLDKIEKLNYKGYGRLSRKLIDGLVGKDNKGNPSTIIEIMRESNKNFMEIINERKYEFKYRLEDENDLKEKVTYENVKALQGSPSIKRAIWKTVNVLEDIVDYVGYKPESICIEFAREEGEKKRTKSREKLIKERFEYILKEKLTIAGEVISKDDEVFKNTENVKLSVEKNFLYILQHGKCMYTGKPLNIQNIADYEVDHIIPQAYVIDNSLDNKVLVKKIENQYKGDNLLLNNDVIQKMRIFWNDLYKCGLISQKKLYNLCRTTFSEDERVGFVNRQLVETRQITKHVANIVKQMFDCNVVSIKASSNTEIRDKFALYKLRGLNDVHHAHDAYLTALLGNFMIQKYPYLKTEMAFDSYRKISAEMEERIKENKKLKYSFLVNQLNSFSYYNNETGEVIWEGSNSINYIKKIMTYKDPIVTYKTLEKKGELYNTTIRSPRELETSDKDKIIDVKRNRPFAKYGGYTSLTTAYSIGIEYQKRNKKEVKVISVPIVFSKSPKALSDYIKATEKINDYEVIIKKIPINQMFMVYGCRFRLASATEWKIMEQIFIDYKYHKLLSEVFKNRITYDSCIQHLELIEEIIRVGKRKIPLLENKLEKIQQSINALKQSEMQVKIETLNSLIVKLLEGMKGNRSDIVLSDLKAPIDGSIAKEKGEKISSFGRLNDKKTDIEKTIFIYDSPSGLRRKYVKYK